jgi:uncharacterized C2H2 Zn-finger protein
VVSQFACPARSGEGETAFRCALCGATFRQGAAACGVCPFASTACELVSCPHCGYSFPRSSSLLRWLERAIGRRKGAA